MEKTEQAAGNRTNLESGEDLIIRMKNPINFERESYDKIDLNGLRDIKASDMVSLNRRLSRSGNTETNQEFTLEYALNMANLATGLPLEFFDQLPPHTAMTIKNRVISFLFRPE